MNDESIAEQVGYVKVGERNLERTLEIVLPGYSMYNVFRGREYDFIDAVGRDLLKGTGWACGIGAAMNIANYFF